MKKRILVIIGTTRQNRASEGVAKWVIKNLPANKNLAFELTDLRDFPLTFFDEAIPPLASKGDYKNEIGQAWLAKVKAADGFIIVTGEYNHSIPAVLKNAMDYWYSGWIKNKPVSFVSYGAGAGGVRAVEHLRQVASELKLISLHNEVNIVNIWDAFNENNTIKNSGQVEKLQNIAGEIDTWFDSKKD